ncbi:MAG: hypothetical protein ABSB00_02295 [Minisyncoccia bacterium]|jgi:hypothetical protein
MDKEISHGSMEEVLRNALTNPKHFEGGNPLPTPLSELNAQIKKYDPDGKKALEIVRNMRKKKKKK